jgi:citrate/tricarballylate utilization protein
MYAPPHEFGVNPPQLFSMLRREHADELSSFSSEIKRHERRPLLAGLLFIAGALAVVLVLAASTVGLSGLIATHHLAASPYSVLSYPAILAIGMASLALGVVLLAIEGHRFWRASGERARPSLSEIGRAIRSAAVLTNLGGGGEGCTYPSEEGSSLRRHAHIAVAWGFTLCLVATIAAAVLQDLLGDEPPYGWISVPVLLGLVGGVGLVVGSLALSIEKSRVDPAATDSASVLREYGFLLALFLLGVGGLVTLLTRTTPIYGIVLALHLATVFACFVLAPFTKFTHALYRFLALVRDEHERAVERVAVGL